MEVPRSIHRKQVSKEQFIEHLEEKLHASPEEIGEFLELLSETAGLQTAPEGSFRMPGLGTTAAAAVRFRKPKIM